METITWVNNLNSRVESNKQHKSTTKFVNFYNEKMSLEFKFIESVDMLRLLTSSPVWSVIWCSQPCHSGGTWDAL